MITRGFILLGFGSTGMRTGHGSLEEEDTLLAFGKVRVRQNNRPSEAYHLIFNFLSADIRVLQKGEKKHTFIFCTVVMIVLVSSIKGNFAEWLSLGDRAIACFPHITSFHPFVPVPGQSSLSYHSLFMRQAGLVASVQLVQIYLESSPYFPFFAP